ncbi:nucleoside recognition domain-containing protein [Paenibacillus spongiae]|uniref:Nucleoside recognition domain-containing protein n=1 Tax=Paenibacillus spongiae TaxID=2909671 RepID=A0ABY5SEQ5_9BACL|nr:nucleoside recognition domain-containing protein [Paenibacillus spongiae]UVI32456.1 nucleoside recognition domain-containing protein [Paenibacillus spongiae]
MLRTITFAALSLMLVTAIIYRPSEAFQASLQGLTVWWNIVFPGLLPFLTMLELMLAFGAVHALGTLLHPLMRRLFRLPGEAGFALVLGWTGGFPAGAESAAALRKTGLLTRSEGQRLLEMAHMPSPLFIIVVVGAGFLNRPELGLAIAGTVWLTGLLSSLVLARFSREQPQMAEEQPRHTGLFRRAAAAMADARNRDGRSFGKTLGDAVTVSVAKLMAIGGFMMMCAVIAGLVETLLNNAIPAPLLTGLLESHIGAFSAATAQIPGGQPWNIAAITAILSWGGLSSLLQAGSALGGTDLSVWRLAVHRLLQAILAFILSLTVTNLIVKYAGAVIDSSPAMLQNGSHEKRTGPWRVSELPDIWPHMPVALLTFAGILVLLCLISAGAARRDRPYGR